MGLERRWFTESPITVEKSPSSNVPEKEKKKIIFVFLKVIASKE